MAEVLRKVLAPQCDVVVYHHAEQAIADLRAGHPCDAMLCDQLMDGIDGRTCFAAVARTRPQLADRFALVSGDDSGLEGWQGPMLRKPFRVEQARQLAAALVRGLT